MTHKVHLFLTANARSSVAYFSVDQNCCVYRLLDGTTWRLSFNECREIGVPRFAYVEAA